MRWIPASHCTQANVPRKGDWTHRSCITRGETWIRTKMAPTDFYSFIILEVMWCSEEIVNPSIWVTVPVTDQLFSLKQLTSSLVSVFPSRWQLQPAAQSPATCYCIKSFTGTQPIQLYFMTAHALQWQSWVVAAEIIQSSNIRFGLHKKFGEPCSRSYQIQRNYLLSHGTSFPSNRLGH